MRFPQRTNVQFIAPSASGGLSLAIWERGAGYTLASGSSACAAAAVAVRLGWCASPVQVEMPGGTLEIHLAADGAISQAGEVLGVYAGEQHHDLLQELQHLGAVSRAVAAFENGETSIITRVTRITVTYMRNMDSLQRNKLYQRVTRQEQFFFRIYLWVYMFICGAAVPAPRPGHFQWLSRRETVHFLRTEFGQFHGRVLDVGCGTKPYATWISPRVTEYLGLDIDEASSADVVASPGEAFPFPDAHFDCAVSIECLEHVEDIEQLLQEIHRVLKPGGKLTLTIPFLFYIHGEEDYRRPTPMGMRRILEQNRFEVEEIKGAERFGSVWGLFLLCWLDALQLRNKVTRVVGGLLLPVWILFSFCVNMLAVAVDCLDVTGKFYIHTLARARKPAAR